MKVTVSTVHLPSALPYVYVWLASLLAPVAVAALNIVLGHHGVVHASIGHVEGHFHPISALVLYLITALVMSKIVSDASRRRREAIHRNLVIDECNHHIRNALQSLAGLAYLAANAQQIEAAVSRIERTLSVVLPRLQNASDRRQTRNDAPHVRRKIVTNAAESTESTAEKLEERSQHGEDGDGTQS